MDDKLTEAVAKVELGMRTIQVVIGERRLSVGIDSEAERFANDLAAAWNARTEAKVSGEVVSNLRVWWVDGQLLYDGIEDETYRDSDHSEDVAVVILEDLKAVPQLPAPQSPLVGESEPVGFVSRVDIESKFSGGFLVLRNMANIPENYVPVYLHSAPQSPVVPGVEELKSIYLDGFDYGSELDPVDDGIKRIHAHLLANARESLEGVLRNALQTTLRVINEQAQMNGCIKGTLWADDITTLVEFIDEALATVGREG